MKKIGILLFLILITGSLWAQSPQVDVDTLSPTFMLNKGEVQKTINVKNISNQPLICTPEIFNDNDYINPKYYIGSSFLLFPKAMQLEPNQTGSFNIYVYNVSQLQDGEYDAMLRVNTKSLNDVDQTRDDPSMFIIKQEGVVEVFNGTLIQNLTLQNLHIEKSTQTSGGSVIGDIANLGNVHMPYQLSYSLFDSSGNTLDSGTLSGNVQRGNTTPLNISFGEFKVVKAEISMSVQDITTKQFGNPTHYVVEQ